MRSSVRLIAHRAHLAFSRVEYIVISILLEELAHINLLVPCKESLALIADLFYALNAFLFFFAVVSLAGSTSHQRVGLMITYLCEALVSAFATLGDKRSLDCNDFNCPKILADGQVA